MQTLRHWLGVELDPVSFLEKAVSTAGGLIAILLVIVISREALLLDGAAMLIASMGASAVLLFAVPHGALSQPWPVIAGQTLSALIGVTCAKYIPDTGLAAACAVGLAIGAMHQFKCIHPPGGATALTAVVAGPDVAALGYSFVLCPVLVNALIMVFVAIAFNCCFKWRRYPAAWNPKVKPSPASKLITHESVVAALRSLDSFVDITEEDLVRLVHILCEAPAINGSRNRELVESNR